MFKEEFIEKSKKVHGDKYDYALVPSEFNAKDKVTIICPTHGEFTQCAREHYRGHGCPKCSKDRVKESLTLTTSTFLDKYHDRFGDKYDTSLVEYVNFETPIKLICHSHGVFEKTPRELMRGGGCPKCSHENTARSKTWNKEKFIEEARKVHGDKYDYSKVEYVKQSVDVIITCPIHGDFKQTPRKHLMGSGCKECGYEKNRETFRKPIEDVIEQCKVVHNNKYEYVLDFEYINNKSILHAICPIHGEFNQEINAHLHGQGCPECAYEDIISRTTLTTDEFIERSRMVHGDKYDYSKTKYRRSKEKVTITCPIHGDFEQKPNFHLMGSGCPKCSHQVSKWEKEVYDFLISLGIECEQSNRSILNGREIDIFVPKYNIGIECDGLRWHNELYRDNNYHLDKTDECREHGVRLIHIFEDEWINKSEIWKSMFNNMFGLIHDKIYARKCDIREVSAKDTRKFLDDNHIQGYSNSRINYGLYYDDELVSLMTFGMPRINMGGKKGEGCYELVRFCNKINMNVIGGASRLFKHFIEKYNPSEVVSYSDKRWSLGNLYGILGFVHTHDSKPNYFYVYNMDRLNRFRFRKSVLVNEGYDKDKTEHEIMLERGIYRIYDCGTMVWKWKKNG